MAIDPLASFAFVPNSVGTDGTLSTFSIAADGALTQIQGSPVAAGTSPCSAAVDSSGGFVYVANSGSANVSAYSIDATTGALTALTGSPFAALNGADTIVLR
jgi:6-phosphogluconolactonase (cycloisomerase 2 family)